MAQDYPMTIESVKLAWVSGMTALDAHSWLKSKGMTVSITAMCQLFLYWDGMADAVNLSAQFRGSKHEQG